MANQEIKEIWFDNLHLELQAINECLRYYNWIAIDTEFPGFLRNTPRNSSELNLYNDLKYNVDRLNPIQLGFTIFNLQGFIGGTWQINFSNFDDNAHNREDPNASISLTKRKSGIDFARQRAEGVDSHLFSLKLRDILRRHEQNNIHWVTFHGLYDLAYTGKILTGGMPLPNSVAGFQSLVNHVFGCDIYDVKSIARFCVGLSNGEIGLEKMGRILNVKRMGKAHQAGSDSLVTACVYLSLIKRYGIVSELHKGFLYGLGGRIEKNNKAQVLQQRVVVVPFHCVNYPCFVQPRTLVINPYSQLQQFVPFLH